MGRNLGPGGLAEANIGADITGDVREFALALERYRRTHRRPFPTASEVLAVAVSLGYRKTAEPTELPGRDDISGPR